MSRPEVSKVDSSMYCITDCSILNTTSCQPVNRRQLVTSADQVRSIYCQAPSQIPKPPRPSPNPVKSSQNQFQRDWG